MVLNLSKPIAAYFAAHPADFKIPEKRKIRFLVVDIDALRAKITVPVADIERAYNDNLDQYSTPEQIRASHILLRTEGKDEAAVKAKAEDVLKQAKSGADFGALAKKYSEDEASAKNNGDLDYKGGESTIIYDITKGYQRALQFPADLSFSAGKEDLQRNTSAWRSGVPRRSLSFSAGLATGHLIPTSGSFQSNTRSSFGE